MVVEVRVRVRVRVSVETVLFEVSHLRDQATVTHDLWHS